MATALLAKEPRVVVLPAPMDLFPGPLDYRVPVLVGRATSPARGHGGLMGAADRGLEDTGKVGATPRPDAFTHLPGSIAAATAPRDPGIVGPGPGGFGTAPQRQPAPFLGVVGPGSHLGLRSALAERAARPGPPTFGTQKRQDALDHAKFSGAVPNGVDVPGPEYDVRAAVPPIVLSRVLEPRHGPGYVKQKARSRLKGMRAMELRTAKAVAPVGFTPRAGFKLKEEAASTPTERRPKSVQHAAPFHTSSPRKHFTAYMTRQGKMADPATGPGCTKYLPHPQSSLVHATHNARAAANETAYLSGKRQTTKVSAAPTWADLSRKLKRPHTASKPARRRNRAIEFVKRAASMTGRREGSSSPTARRVVPAASPVAWANTWTAGMATSHIRTQGRARPRSAAPSFLRSQPPSLAPSAVVLA